MTETQEQVSMLVHFTRGMFFLLFSTIGLASIALACLAGPVSQYYDDKEYLIKEAQQIQKLEQFSQQQQGLLENIIAADPSVIQRIAIYTLNYQKRNEQTEAESQEQATVVNEKVSEPDPEIPKVFANIINENINYQRGLVLFGTILTTVSLTCFNRKSSQA
ncbi:MAG: hypothetical protein JEZ07_00495 [Phycisphaerae bacterium]|nr:hypothetical protein [Phycisphaerae bacterium]